MTRTVIPVKLLSTVEVGPYRAHLRQWEHYPGQTPTITLEIWKGWNLLSSEQTIGIGHVEKRWVSIKEELATRIAREALGLEIK